MFKKPYENELEYIKGKKNTKEEMRQRSNYLEKLDSPPPPPEKSFKTCTLEPTKINKHFLQKIICPKKIENNLQKRVSRLAGTTARELEASWR